VAWLHFLRTNGFGGILADEMGGSAKTLQVLALINSRRAFETPAPVLVVCPTSLVFNWAAEAAKFTSDLRVLTLQGQQRNELFGRIAQHDLIVTVTLCCGATPNDIAAWSSTRWFLMKRSTIKNRETQNAQAVKSIPRAASAGGHRDAVGKLGARSLVDLRLPDARLPGHSAGFSRAVTSWQLCATRMWRRRVGLRGGCVPSCCAGLKREVASDLPEKIEQVEFCDLNDEQRALYPAGARGQPAGDRQCG